MGLTAVQVKIWDYQNKTCVQTLEGHAQNISSAVFHPELPILLTGSEDGTVRVWHSTTYRLETTLNYGLERVWTICCLPGSNNIALGYDEGAIMIKLGREEPAMSMDQVSLFVSSLDLCSSQRPFLGMDSLIGVSFFSAGTLGPSRAARSCGPNTLRSSRPT